MRSYRYFFATILSITLHLIFFSGGNIYKKTKIQKNERKKMEVILNKSKPEKYERKKIINKKVEQLTNNRKLPSIKADMNKSSGIINKDNVDNLKKSKPNSKNPTNYKEPKIYFKKPEYPYISRVLEEEGRVVLNVRIGKEDNILSVSVLESSGYKRLDKIVVKSIRNAKVESAVKNGKKIITEKKVGPFVFKLENKN